MGGLFSTPKRYYVYPEPRLTFNSIDTVAALELQQQSCDLISKLQWIGEKGAGFVGVPSEVIDGLNNVINFLLQKEAIAEELLMAKVNAKIDAKAAQLATSQFKAKLGAVQQHLNDLCGSGNSMEEQRMGISQAVMACNEIFNLFEDKEYIFYKSPLLYINTLLSFATVHKTVLVLAKKFMPSVYGPSGEEKLKSLVQLYINRFKEERLSENVISTNIVQSALDIGNGKMTFSDFQALIGKVPADAPILEVVVDRNYGEKNERIPYSGGLEKSEYKDKLWNLYNSEFRKILDQL